MTSVNTICECLAKLYPDDTRPRANRSSHLRRKLLVLAFAAFQFVARGSAALPVVIGADQQTGRFGPHSFPGWVPVGDKVEVYAGVESSDPLGSPTISVLAVQDSTTLTLDPLPLDPLFEGFPFSIYHKFIDLDPALTGSWEITSTDSTGTGLPTFGDAIIEPEFLPLVDDIAVEGTPVGAQVTWTPPNLEGFDVDEVAVRVIEATSGRHMWQSEPLPVETTSFGPPSGVLNVGVDYVYAVILGDIDGLRFENLSWAFSEPFRYTIPGDFNTNGTVDAADYVAWRETNGSSDGYNTWRANFGHTAGSGSALPSVESLSAAVPEASTVALAAAGVLASLAARTWRRTLPSRGTCAGDVIM